MTTSDSEKKRQRLAQLYASMSEGELQKLAEDAGSLTEAARAALKFEFPRRGLRTQLDDSAAAAERVEHQKHVTLRQFRDLPEALLAKGVFDSAGIESFLADENMVRMDWFISNALGGIKLWVRQEDAGAAADLLDQDFAEGFDMGGGKEYKQPTVQIASRSTSPSRA